MTNNLQNLPPEMQERIAQIIEQGKATSQQPQATAPVPSPPPVVRHPSLMDHVIALRQEVAALSQMVQAQGQVTEAVGNAVGQLYQMFCTQTEVTDHGATYASQFQQQPVTDDDY